METLKEKIAKFPTTPGVYRFLDNAGTVLYVGKAKNLRSRVSSYVSKEESLAPKTRAMVHQSTDVIFTETPSEFDALLLEATLIRTLQPKYNILARDDKSPIYLVLTRDEVLPRVLFARKTELTQYEHGKNEVYGPFQKSYILKRLLSDLRKSIPYCTQKQRNGKRCFYTHIGLCDPCPSYIAKLSDSPQRQALVKRYRANIQRLSAIFSGKSTTVLHELESQMHQAANRMEFEAAQRVKEKLEALYRVTAKNYDPEYFISDVVLSWQEEELSELRGILSVHFPQIPPLSRIECIDISHLSGDHPVGSLVVLTNGKPDTRQYRIFKANTKGINDPAMIAEVISRRFMHTEWEFPTLLVVDGGKPQVHAAEKAMKELGLAIPIIGLAKRREEVILLSGETFITLELPITGSAIKVLQRVRDEAHRFAKKMNTKLRRNEK